MRSNSGRDEGRNNMRDPTVRDRELGRDLEKDSEAGRTSEMGSQARKTGQEGEDTPSDDTIVAGETVESERQD